MHGTTLFATQLSACEDPDLRMRHGDSCSREPPAEHNQYRLVDIHGSSFLLHSIRSMFCKTDHFLLCRAHIALVQALVSPEFVLELVLELVVVGHCNSRLAPSQL